MKYHVIKEYKSPYPEPIVFNKGDIVAVGKEFTDDPDWNDWIWCEGSHNNKAWAPKQYLDIEKEKGTFKQDYNALELSVSVGEEIAIYEVVNGFGLAEKSDGSKGWVPLKHLEPLKS